jgi:hypothetical protein
MSPKNDADFSCAFFNATFVKNGTVRIHADGVEIRTFLDDPTSRSCPYCDSPDLRQEMVGPEPPMIGTDSDTSETHRCRLHVLRCMSCLRKSLKLVSDEGRIISLGIYSELRSVRKSLPQTDLLAETGLLG